MTKFDNPTSQLDASAGVVKHKATLSIVLPARNEAGGLDLLLPKLVALYPDAQIIVINDGSTDDTLAVCERYGVTTATHVYSMGNGAAIKQGAARSTGEYVVFMDADGQHNPADIAKLVSKLDEGYDMVVGARDGKSQANIVRWIGNSFYSAFASWMVNHTIADLTSGFRAVRTARFKEFLHLLPNGFSYPTTITMAFFRSGYAVAYVPINAARRIGKSHIRLIRDGIRFLLVVFRIGTLFAPLKVFLPVSFCVFSTGLSYYIYTYLTTGRFTNMSALLLVSAVLIFLIGLISEQITMLIYQKHKDN